MKKELPVNFKDDVLKPEMTGKRRYRVTQYDDGTISLDDVTEYSQIGSNFGAAQMNATNEAVNESFDKKMLIDSLDDIVANTKAGYAAGALGVKMLKEAVEQFKYKKEKLARIGIWGSAWTLGTSNKNIGSGLPGYENAHYKVTTGSDAAITVKNAGLYFVCLYAQGKAENGASSCIEASVMADKTLVDDTYALFGATYSYNNMPTSINAGRLIYIPENTTLSAFIRKTNASGSTVTSGNSYMEILKMY